MSTAHTLTGGKRIVVKIGSALLAHDDGRLRAEWLDALAQDIAKLRDGGAEILIVSSGAIAVGRRLLGLARGPRNRALRLEESQAAAAAPSRPASVTAFVSTASSPRSSPSVK